ncbi:hypothetical protein ACFLYV_03895 [Chloroflexota bacterium]
MFLGVDSTVFAILTLAIFILVGLILQFNNENDASNIYNWQKGWIIKYIAKYKGFGWAGKPKAITKMLVAIGFILTLCNALCSE